MLRYLFFVLLLISTQSAKAQNSFFVDKDTVWVTGVEMVIRNATQNVQGYLYNSDYGKTDFKKLGKAIQFKVGSAGFPIAGDTAYTSGDLVKKNIKVWRSGLLQSISNSNGVTVDSLVGKVIFHPALIQAEKVYIEAFNSIDFSFRTLLHPYYLASREIKHSSLIQP
jgi:hypothetical protein